MTITELLDRSRRELLDLSTRNRLLAVPPRVVLLDTLAPVQEYPPGKSIGGSRSG